MSLELRRRLLGIAAGNLKLQKGTVLEPRGAGVADARGRRAASPPGGWVVKAKNEVVFGVWKAKALFRISALLSARVRERRSAFCFCQKAALWCGCASCALSWGKADLRRTAEIALARTIRSLRGALDLGSLRRPSRPHQL